MNRGDRVKVLVASEKIAGTNKWKLTYWHGELVDDFGEVTDDAGNKTHELLVWLDGDDKATLHLGYFVTPE